MYAPDAPQRERDRESQSQTNDRKEEEEGDAKEGCEKKKNQHPETPSKMWVCEKKKEPASPPPVSVAFSKKEVLERREKEANSGFATAALPPLLPLCTASCCCSMLLWEREGEGVDPV
jgi:hypothetical protein